MDRPVSVTLPANDTGGSGVAEVRYTTDGSAPNGSSTLYTGAFDVNTTTTVRFRAEDNAGNVGALGSQVVLVDTAAPVSSISCNGGACQSSYTRPVQAALSAIDSGSSGLKENRYTTDDSAPTGSSPLSREVRPRAARNATRPAITISPATSPLTMRNVCSVVTLRLGRHSLGAARRRAQRY